MRNWDARDELGDCPGDREQRDCQAVAHKLGIQLHVVSFEREYWQEVFTPFLHDYERGLTPNPDVDCNRTIKFAALLQHVRSTLGARFLATGHYARLLAPAAGAQDTAPRLAAAADLSKDQSYFLCRVDRAAWADVLFPLAELGKAQDVRPLARALQLPTSAKRESMGLCFVGKRNFKQFIARYIEPAPGEIVTSAGTVLGRHEGVFLYTPGQRVRLGGQSHAWYVLSKDAASRRVVVVSDEQSALLNSARLEARGFVWQSREHAAVGTAVQARLRHLGPLYEATISRIDGEHGDVLCLELGEPARAAAPGQVLALYEHSGAVLGGGVLV